MVLKLYYDLMSQPSRALYILLKSIRYNFESKYVHLRKGDHFSEEFTKVNRMQKVPVIDHDGFILTESVAIFKYLSREGIIPDSLYPKETKQQARVDEFLEWQHLGLRLHCTMYFRSKYLEPMLSGETNLRRIETFERHMLAALEDLDTKWLGRGTDYITGNSVTVADLLAACELEQPRMARFDPREKFPNIAVWIEKVQQHFNPHYDEAHLILNKIAEKQNAMNSKL